jgi:hypothetical protein
VTSFFALVSELRTMAEGKKDCRESAENKIARGCRTIYSGS